MTRNIGPVFSAMEGWMLEALGVGRRCVVWRGMSSEGAC